MSPVAIRTATPLDEALIIDVITLAFVADPALRWLYPDPREYLTSLPEFARGYGGRAFDQGRAHFVEGYVGAALWLAPDVHPDEEALNALLERSPPERRNAVLEILAQLDRYHPTEPHWHLAMIAIDPANQHCGYGSALMQRGLEPCDRNGQAAYLESTNPMNLPFYERHGFDLLGTIQVGAVPPVYPMLRRPSRVHES
jgi:ribosomal protein S18 acetylase RimI-like enzyme